MSNMNYTFEEAELEIDRLFDKLVEEAETDKEKYSLKQIWSTYKQGKCDEEDEAYDSGYEAGYEAGCECTRSQYED